MNPQELEAECTRRGWKIETFACKGNSCGETQWAWMSVLTRNQGSSGNGGVGHTEIDAKLDAFNTAVAIEQEEIDDIVFPPKPGESWLNRALQLGHTRLTQGGLHA